MMVMKTNGLSSEKITERERSSRRLKELNDLKEANRRERMAALDRKRVKAESAEGDALDDEFTDGLTDGGNFFDYADDEYEFDAAAEGGGGDSFGDRSETEDDLREALEASRERELMLLRRLGYDGDYDEAVAAFEADVANDGDASRAPLESSGGTELMKKNAERSVSEANDKKATRDGDGYEALARKMLNEINDGYGLDLKDYSAFEDLGTFAELSRDERFGPLKAFAATNPKMMRELAKKEALASLQAPQRQVAALPRSEGESAVGGTTIPARKIAEYRELFPQMSRNEIIKLINRVNKNTR